MEHALLDRRGGRGSGDTGRLRRGSSRQPTRLRCELERHAAKPGRDRQRRGLHQGRRGSTPGDGVEPSTSKNAVGAKLDFCPFWRPFVTSWPKQNGATLVELRVL